MNIKQTTLAKPVSVSGKGLHTGCIVTMNFKPAPVDFGYKFQRVDIDNKPIIEAIVTNVVDTSRGTVIESEGVKVGTIEHTLAALRGLEIDNVLIEIDGPEAPIMDGSAILIMKAIGKDNVVDQDADREYFEVREKIVYSNPENGIELIALPDDDFRVNVMISYNSPVLGNQFATLNSLSDFEKEIAPCRTFVFLHELEFLLNNNLVKGGDIDNAIVIMDRKVSQEELDRIADLFNHKHLEIKEQGILNNLDLQFSNEPARHKLLDVIGDLALVGKPIKGRIIATRPGHSSNIQFGKLIYKEISKQFSKTAAPLYDPNSPAVMDINRIKQLLPHRYPFLLIDKIIEIKEKSIVGVKNITANEPFFQGHFPEEPVMPGVLQIEAMAQTGGLLILNSLPDNANYSTYFMKIDAIKFRKKIVPGDTLILKIELVSPIRRGIASMKGYVFVGDALVSEGEFMAQIIKTNDNIIEK